MEFRQIRLFLEIVRAGGFHRAAASLRVAQPAISVAIRNLEEELGVTLFDRGRKRVRLTAEGRVFFRRATELEGMLRGIEQEMGELRGLNAASCGWACRACWPPMCSPRSSPGFANVTPA